MSRFILVLILAALCLLPMGCIFLGTPPQMPFAEYPYRYTRADFRFAWKTVQLKRDVAVELMLKNLKYASVSGLSVEASLQQGDKTISRSATVPRDLQHGEIAKVAVTFQGVAISAGDEVHFTVRYLGTQGGTTRSLATRFAADAVTGVIDENQSSPE